MSLWGNTVGKIIDNPTSPNAWADANINAFTLGQAGSVFDKKKAQAGAQASPAVTRQVADQYRSQSAQNTPLTLSGANEGQLDAAQSGLNLGKILTGQDIYTTGQQVQDAIQRSQGLVTGDNPVTSEMTGQRNAAVSRAGNQMAKAGIKGGAAVAAQQQVGSAMDKQIASQAHQMYQANLQNHLKTLGGVTQAQITPMYTNQDMYLSATAPTYKAQAKDGMLNDLFSSIFG